MAPSNTSMKSDIKIRIMPTHHKFINIGGVDCIGTRIKKAKIKQSQFGESDCSFTCQKMDFVAIWRNGEWY